MNLTSRFIMPVLAAVFSDFMQPPGRNEKPKRPCLQCGTLHRHNNAFCSSTCCNAYRGIRSGKQ